MANPAEQTKQRLLSHFSNRNENQQISGWTELWDTDQADLWDRGKPSPALIDLVESNHPAIPPLKDGRRPRALIPGCGKGYDVVALALHGYDVYGLEVSETGGQAATEYARQELAEPSAYNYGKLNELPEVQVGSVSIIVGDFFKTDWLPFGTSVFDIIYDYTFLCALHPYMRQAWAQRMHELLSPNGVLICLEFPLYKDLKLPGPPWGLKNVYWNLLAQGGNGMIDDPITEDQPQQGCLQRVAYLKPTRSYENGKGTDMLSIWALLKQ